MIKATETETTIKHYSDENLKIEQVETGNIYDEAVDSLLCKFTYKETDIEIEKVE